MAHPVSATMSRGRGRGRGAAGRGAGQRCTAPVQKWWTSLPDSCPISLVPLAELEQPPFGLSADSAMAPAEGVKVTHYFDARFLAHWLVSSGDLSDPVNRRALTRAECFALDEYVGIHHPELDAVSVTDAFDLQARTDCSRDQQPESRSLQREANSVLQALFQWRRTARPVSDSAGHRVVFREGDLQVIDDDDIIGGPGSGHFELDGTSETSGSAFPPLSDGSTASHTASWPCPRTTMVRMQHGPAAESRPVGPFGEVERESASRRPRLQLKPRSKDLTEADPPSRNESIFGAARPREETLLDAGYKADSSIVRGELSMASAQNSADLCAFSRGALAGLVHGKQQIRTRLLPDIEQTLDQFLADSSRRTIELGPFDGLCQLAVQELCDNCLLDSEPLRQDSKALDDMHFLRVLKNSNSRRPVCWLTRAVGQFAHLVPQSDLIRLRISRDCIVLLTFRGPEGKGAGLQETLQRYSKASELDAPVWLAGGRHVLQRFARRSAAQKCCAAAQHAHWMAQWWSGDAEWAQSQLRQLNAPPPLQHTRSEAVAHSAGHRMPSRQVVDKRYQVREVPRTVGGKWAALASDEDDASEECQDTETGEESAGSDA